MRIKESIGKTVRLVLALIAIVAGPVDAQTISAPTISVQGERSFTVSYTACTACYGSGLEELTPQSSDWQYAGSGQISMTNAPPGTYRYRVVYVVAVAPGAFQPVYGPAASIVVNENMQIQQPVRPSLATQFAAEYAISSGDVDGDGSRELLIRRSVPMPAGGDGTIGNVLLQRNAQGSFEASLPNAQQLAIAAGWSPAQVQLGERDVNIDGYLDLTLQGIDKVPGFVGASNQILFAPGAFGQGQAPSARAVDAELARFSRDIDRHLVDPEYYLNNVPTSYALITYYALNCSWAGYGYASVFDMSAPWSCFHEPQYLYIVYRNFSVFDRDAMEIAGTDYGMIHGFEPVETGMDKIATAIAAVLGVAVGGWDINEWFGPDTVVTDESDRQGMELFAVLAGISEAVAQVVSDQAGPPVTERVELKGRRVLGQGPFHTSLEFRDATVSAFDSDPRAFFDGRLVSQVNWPRDHPSLTLRMGFVDGPTAPPSYWSSILALDSRYDDNLPYDLFPSLGQGGYNSNSYVSGLVQTSLGTPTIQIESFVGAEVPVPASAFN